MSTEKNVNKDLEELLKELDEKAHKVEGVNILFLDVSSTCTGYAIHNVNFLKKEAKMVKYGALWLDQNWKHEEKYVYMYNALVNYFWIVEQIDYIVVEQYSINPKKLMGIHVVPEMIGVIKCAAMENGVKVASILPQSWRATLKIKRENGDWKEPTKKKILEYLDVPETSISNITRNTRNTPNDVYDAVAISIAWLYRLGISFVKFDNAAFNSHIGIINE